MIKESFMGKTVEKKFLYEEAFEQAKNEVVRMLNKAPLIIRSYTRHLAASTGKGIRAASVIACAMDEEGLVPENAIKLAVAIEILHLATLVHDDVIDDADIRRGELSLQKKFGRRTAVICGDYLVCMAMKIAVSAAEESEQEDNMKFQMPDYMSRVCLGELYQHINNGNVDLSVRQYLRIVSGKTAALFEASFYAGAAFIEDDIRIVKKYAKLGRYVGMIFQLTDDCMDFEESEETAKKPVQSDYEQNVITLPLIYAFKKLENFKNKARECILPRSEINEIVLQTGGLDYTRRIAREYYNKALKLLQGMQLPQEKENKLKIILDKSLRL
ncbi:MAG TPA: polyprenyl synthetase family protein [Clostridiales bacterium]|nr:polyprenyl synthetase family protein [Clostridiales bacterium]